MDGLPFYHLETHALKEGEDVSIHETDGQTLTFRVAGIR